MIYWCLTKSIIFFPLGLSQPCWHSRSGFAVFCLLPTRVTKYASSGTCFRNCDISYPGYTENMQLFISLKPADVLKLLLVVLGISNPKWLKTFFGLTRAERSFSHLGMWRHAFVSLPIDYCKSLSVGVSRSALSRLEFLQHATASLPYKLDHPSL